MKRCSTSLIIREMKLTITRGNHLTLVRMAKIKNTRNDRCWQGYGAKGILVHYWWECKLVQPLWTTDWTFLKKLKIEFTIWLSNSTPGYFPKRLQKHQFGKMHAVLWLLQHYLQEPREATQGSFDRWTDKEDVASIYNGILFSHRKEWNLAICNNMDGSRGCNAKWNKSEKDEYHVISLITWNWRSTANKQIKKRDKQKKPRLLTTQNKQMVTKRGGGWTIGWNGWRGLRVHPWWALSKVRKCGIPTLYTWN